MHKGKEINNELEQFHMSPRHCEIPQQVSWESKDFPRLWLRSECQCRGVACLLDQELATVAGTTLMTFWRRLAFAETLLQREKGRKGRHFLQKTYGLVKQGKWIDNTPTVPCKPTKNPMRCWMRGWPTGFFHLSYDVVVCGCSVI